jgi:hypothetical protein
MNIDTHADSAAVTADNPSDASAIQAEPGQIAPADWPTASGRMPERADRCPADSDDYGFEYSSGGFR